MGIYMGPPNERPPGTYRVGWTETSTHEVDLPAETLATLLGITVEQLHEQEASEYGIDPEGQLSDLLADLSDDGFQGLTRDITEITPPEET